MPVAVFAWQWTYWDGSLPAAAEPLPAATRPFNPRLCCETSFVSSCCPSFVNVRLFLSASFISALEALGRYRGWECQSEISQKDEACWNNPQECLISRNTFTWYNLNALQEAKSIVSVFAAAWCEVDFCSHCVWATYCRWLTTSGFIANHFSMAVLTVRSC